LLSGVLLVVSCSKEPGSGGLAIIEGQLYENQYDPLGTSYKSKVAVGDRNIYLKYGDNTTYDDRADTDASGKYSFKNLQKGDYKVFAFSDCSSCPTGIDEVEVNVEISDKKGVTNADDISVVKNLDYDDGTAGIEGVVMEDLYTTVPPIVVENTYEAADEFVYIFYENEEYHFDRVKTDEDGKYQFIELLKGTYTVKVFSDCATCTKGIETKEETAVISSDGESVTLPTITIEKRN